MKQFFKYCRAFNLATQAHKGQKDLQGKDYITHPIRVAKRLNSFESKTVAILHDVIEDTEYSLEMIDKIVHLSSYQKEALLCLTKKEKESSDNYVRRIAKNRLAVEIKLSDLTDNMDMTRFNSTLTEKDIKRLNKYIKEYNFLKNCSNRITEF